MAGDPPVADEPVENVGTWDYVLFILMLGASLGIGVYHAFRDYRRRKSESKSVIADDEIIDAEETTASYFIGKRQMNIVGISVSMIATYVHSNLILGYPAEIYYFGAQYWLYCAGQSLGAILACIVFVPVFYPLQMTSVNEVRFYHTYKTYILKALGCDKLSRSLTKCQ